MCSLGFSIVLCAIRHCALAKWWRCTVRKIAHICLMGGLSIVQRKYLSKWRPLVLQIFWDYDMQLLAKGETMFLLKPIIWGLLHFLGFNQISKMPFCFLASKSCQNRNLINVNYFWWASQNNTFESPIISNTVLSLYIFKAIQELKVIPQLIAEFNFQQILTIFVSMRPET